MTDDATRGDLVAHWSAKADEALAAARLSLQHGLLGSAVNRAYYACFYITGAVLLHQVLQFRKHTGVQAGLHEHLVRPGQLNQRFGATYNRLFEARMRGDYVGLAAIEIDETTELVTQAEELVHEVRLLLPGG